MYDDGIAAALIVGKDGKGGKGKGGDKEFLQMLHGKTLVCSFFLVEKEMSDDGKFTKHSSKHCHSFMLPSANCIKTDKRCKYFVVEM